MRSAIRQGLGLLCVLLGTMVLGAGPAFADDALDKVVTVDIPAQPLTGALILLSKQSGTQILTSAGLVGDRNTDGVHGQMSIREALSGLLKGSPLGFHAAGDNTIGIDATPAARPEKGGAPHGGAAAAAPGQAMIVADSATAAPPEAPKAATSLAEIIVTATKRDQSVRKIPGTVDVLKGKDLEDIGARDMQDFLKYIPGITLQEGDTNSNRTISIRGVGPQPGANTTVGSLIDDVSMGDPYSSYLVPDLDPFDLHDLEVLKGPQGTLFGASALNGAIRYVLNKPLMGEWEAKGFADWLHIQGAGSGETYGGAVNIPVGQSFALRAVDVVQSIPGLYDDNNVNGKHEKDADNGFKRMHRFLATWQPLEDLSVNAFYLQQANHRNDLSIANNVNGEFVRTDTPGPSSSSQRFSVANLDVRYNFDWATLISETSHTTKKQDLDYDGSAVLEPLAVAGLPTLRLSSLVQSNSTSQELRLVSAPGDSPWVWIFGGYYNRYRAALDQNIYLANTQPVATILNELGLPDALLSALAPTTQGLSVEYITFHPLKATEESLFGELTRKLWDNRLQLTVGGRLYRETLLTNVGTTGLLGPLGVLENFTGDKSTKSEGFNPKAAATFQVTDNLLWYAAAAHGFQFGGINAPAPIPTDNTFPQIYKPSTIWSYETGERLDLFHKRLQFDLTAFLLNWKDMQIQQKTPDGITTFTENIGSARSKGLESSIRWLTPIPGLTLSTTASYIHAKVAAPYTTSNGIFIPTGTDLPAAPRLQTSTTLAYNIPLGPIRTGAAFTWSHQGHAFSNITHDAVVFRYNTLDFHYNLTLPHLFMSPAFTLNATNLLNAHALIGAQIDHVLNTEDGSLAAYNRPRTIDLRISGQF